MENNTKETGRTVRKQKEPYIEVAQDTELRWHWCLWSSNGQAIAMNAVSYERRNDCHQAVEIAKRIMTEQPRVVTQQETKRRIRKKRGPNVNQQQTSMPPTIATGTSQETPSGPQTEKREPLSAAAEEATPIG